MTATSQMLQLQVATNAAAVLAASAAATQAEQLSDGLIDASPVLAEKLAQIDEATAGLDERVTALET